MTTHCIQTKLNTSSPPNSPYISDNMLHQKANDQENNKTNETCLKFEKLTCEPYSPPQTPMGSISSTPPSTHIDLSEKKDACDETQTCRSKRRESAQYNLDVFKLVRTLGTGSFGRVHLAQSKITESYCAIKVLRKEDVVRLKQVEHTRNEREILSKIKNDFIISLWGTFQDDGNLYMVMDYVPGGELFSYMRTCGTLSEDTTRFYAAQVLLALSYLHGQDIIYRDLKPENLLLDAQGYIKITDFGFAKVVPDITWTLCGTPDYLAPEIIQSKGYGKPVDYWALGVLIYEMLTGTTPFYDESVFKIYEKIVACKPVYPTTLFSPQAIDLLNHLMTPDLSNRYGNLKRGYLDIVQHPWFQSTDFDQLSKRTITAPYVPPVKSEGDSSNFDTYDENTKPYGISEPDPYRKLFMDF